MKISKLKNVLKEYGFSKNIVDENKLKNNYDHLKGGNLKIFNKLNGNIGIGPLFSYTAIFIITKFPKNKEWSILFARKAFGGNSSQQRPGERHKVGHTYYTTKSIVKAYGPYSGAAGTKSKYWGKWVTIGGKNDSKASSNFLAAFSEFKDETASNLNKHLHFLLSFNNSNTMIYLAYLPPIYANKLDTSPGVKKNLIFSSKGEIAELRWVDYDKVIGNIILKNGLADYVERTYNNNILPIISVINTL